MHQSGRNSSLKLRSCSSTPSSWKRSRVVYKQMTPMDKFHKQLLRLYQWERQSNNESSLKLEEESVLVDNVNNFIPTNEIGLGVILLNKTDTNPGSIICSSTDNKAQHESSTTVD
ncbi:hypothetical protein JHK86_021773 [Glycine max]|nr:hypothetical protein JHK86_021773 [Glycine max]